ncbi:MAG: cation:proton antiporter [Bdellovibrionia bacterium]
MPHLPELIADLSLILITAAIVTLLFKKLNQPLVLGYLLAGLLVGPHTTILPSVSDLKSVHLWAEMGIIFLLFALGLEFSFKKLARTGKSSGITSVLEVGSMIFIGYSVGKYLGWNTMDSIFLGGIISISSTSIILRVVDEMGLKAKKYVGHVFGILIFEDLFAILMMVLLSTVAVSQQVSGWPMLAVVLKLVFFLMLWFVVGMFVLPTLLKKSQGLLSEETVLVISVGLCLLMVVIANKVGFSSALGAFVAGSLLAETVEAERIHHVIKPVRDLFSAVFFVSVGMLINPDILAEQWQAVLLISAVVIVGKIVTVTIGSVFSGQDVRCSIHSGLAMSQIGEFSFILATVGLSLKVISESLYPLAVSVSVITAFTSPYLIKYSDIITERFVGKIPSNLMQALTNYSNASLSLSGNRDYQNLLRAYLMKIIVNSVLVIAIFLFFSRLVLPWLMERHFDWVSSEFLVLMLTLIVSSPFLWAIAFGSVPNIELLYYVSRNGVRTPNYVFLISRLLIAVVLLAAMITQFVGFWWGMAIAIWMFIVVGLIVSKYLKQLYVFLEDRFLHNLKGEGTTKDVAPSLKLYSQLAPWDAHLTEFEIAPESVVVGKELVEMSIRERFGVTIAVIERGKKIITTPQRHERLMSHDKIFVIGTDEQLLAFQTFLTSEENVSSEAHLDALSLEQYVIPETSPFIFKAIRDSGIREATQGLVVGIEREGKRILNPDSSEILKPMDLLWIVGDKDKIRSLA